MQRARRQLLRQPPLKGTERLFLLLAAALIVALIAYPATGSNYGMLVVRDALIFGLLALSLDFFWGKTGELSFGHSAFLRRRRLRDGDRDPQLYGSGLLDPGRARRRRVGRRNRGADRLLPLLWRRPGRLFRDRHRGALHHLPAGGNQLGRGDRRRHGPARHSAAPYHLRRRAPVDRGPASSSTTWCWASA